MDKKFIKLCVDTALGTIPTEFSASKANEEIVNKFYEILGDTKLTYKNFRRNKVQIYEIIEETMENLIQSGWGNNTFFQSLVDDRNLSLGDKNEFYVPDNSMLVVSKFSGDHHDLRRQKLDVGTSTSIETSWYGVKIYTEFSLLMAGRIDWAEFVQKIYEAFDKKILDMVYTSFMSYEDSLPTDLKDTGSIDGDDVMELVETVATAAGTDAMIVGTRTAINKLIGTTPVEWISDDMKKDRNTTGTLGIWNGIKLLVLPNVFKANTRERQIDNSKLMIVPNSSEFKPIKLVNEGENRFYENSDSATNQDMTVDAEYQHKLGVAVVMNMLYGVYTII